MYKEISRRIDFHDCPKSEALPHIGGPILSMPPTEVLVTGLEAARLADYAACMGSVDDLVVQGAAMVLIKGLPVAHVSSHCEHGGSVKSGAPDVFVGGPTFELPSNFTFDGSKEFKNRTVRDLYFLSTKPSGAEYLRRLGIANQTVTFREHAGINGYCMPVNRSNQIAGNPTGSVILYNPDYRSNAYDASGNLLAQPPQTILAHEMGHALHNAEGHFAQGQDPNPPASEPNIGAEESQAIGTGSYGGAFPTENTLRSELGLGRRDNHFGSGGPAPGEPPIVQLRPGGY
jgi:uncharacterized Zn-binding protein involved in type VI secretion